MRSKHFFYIFTKQISHKKYLKNNYLKSKITFKKKLLCPLKNMSDYEAITSYIYIYFLTKQISDKKYFKFFYHKSISLNMLDYQAFTSYIFFHQTNSFIYIYI